MARLPGWIRVVEDVHTLPDGKVAFTIALAPRWWLRLSFWIYWLRSRARAS